MLKWGPASFFERAGEGGIRCTLCPFRCVLRDGDAGVCKVRRRVGDAVLTATRQTSVVHADAVERKPFYHWRPGSTVLTLAPPGCSFRCDYCVNHRLSQVGRDEDAITRTVPVDPAAIVRQAADAGAGVCLSYTEPSLAPELTLDLAAHAAPLGVPVLWKTNGFVTPHALRELAPALAAVNVDLKAAGEEEHRRLTGAPLRPVLDTLRLLREAGVWTEVSTPLIPGVSAEPERLAAIAAFVASLGAGTPWHLLRFTPAHRMRDHAPTRPADLAAGVRAGRAAGLRYVYVERALDAPGRATHCPGCGGEVITRRVWGLTENRLTDGACPDCGTTIEGSWA